MLVTAVLLAVYILTLAPTVTYWDAGEFLAAMHSLGIPHPPGTPLYILIGNVWGSLFGELLGFARAVNLLSALCTAAACGLFTRLMAGWTKRPIAAVAGGLCAGLMSSVWLNATETEVYAPALLMSVLLLVVADSYRVSGETRWLVMLAYLCGLGWTLQLSALVSAPAAIALTFVVRRRLTIRSVSARMVAAALVGASAVLFMIIRAQHDPAVNQGNPATWQALLDVVTRAQYQPASLLPRQAPFYLQIGNLFEYADWQIALDFAPGAPPSWRRTPFTIVFALLAIVGCVWHRRADRVSWRVMMLLFACATLGVIVYLNMKAGPSYGHGFLPPGAKHEARERDYFFALAFVCWGWWAGAGAVRAFSVRNARLGLAGVAIAILPAALNWRAVDRSEPSRATAARDGAMRVIGAAPPRAVVFVYGDNDTYPAWYLQQVEGRRRDVTVVTVPLLGAAWYRGELARRHELIAQTYVTAWRGKGATVEEICREAHRQQRPVDGASACDT